MRPGRLGSLVVAAAFVATGCSSAVTPSPTGTPSARPPDVVDLKDFKFVPARLTVRQGTTIRYVNGDRAEHTVTQGEDGEPAPGGAFDATLAIEATTPITFATPGEIKVTCKVHPTMNQTVVVEPG